MLHAAAHLDHAVVAHGAERGLGLEVGVLDERRAEFLLDDEGRLGESALDVAPADHVAVDEVRAVLLVDERRARGQGRVGIEDLGQRLGLDAHQPGGGDGLVPGLGHDHGHHVAVVADLVVGQDVEVLQDLPGPVAAGDVRGR